MQHFSGINICFQSSVFLVRFAEVHTLMCFHILNFVYLFDCFGRFGSGPGEDMKFGKSDLICPEFPQAPHYITLFYISYPTAKFCSGCCTHSELVGWLWAFWLTDLSMDLSLREIRLLDNKRTNLVEFGHAWIVITKKCRQKHRSAIFFYHDGQKNRATKRVSEIVRTMEQHKGFKYPQLEFHMTDFETKSVPHFSSLKSLPETLSFKLFWDLLERDPPSSTKCLCTRMLLQNAMCMTKVARETRRPAL